jgi:alkaline phosphatase D
MPDLRYYRDSKNNNLLSENQWEWLEQIFKNSDDQIYFLVSGIQLLASNRIFNFEKWPKKELKRLIDLIQKYKKNGVVLISGDVHHAQFLSSNCNPFFGSYKLLEITTSGLTHTCNKNIFGFCDQVLDILSPRTFYKSMPIV